MPFIYENENKKRYKTELSNAQMMFGKEEKH